MALRNTSDAYGSVAKSFHWLMALLVIGMLCVGLWMNGLPMGMQKLKVYGWHKSVGVTILMLAALRLAWRFRNIVPSLPLHMRWPERFAAHASHMLLYALLFAMPFSGWLMSSASGFPVSVFGWFTLPNLVQPDESLRKLFQQAHEWMAWTLIGLIALHASAALFHHFRYRDTVLKRMLP